MSSRAVKQFKLTVRIQPNKNEKRIAMNCCLIMKITI